MALPAGDAGDCSAAPRNRPEEARLDRLKPHRGSMPNEMREAALGQKWRGTTAGETEVPGPSCKLRGWPRLWSVE